MLRQLLSLNPEGDTSPSLTREVMTITNFNLLPGGISREPRSQNTTLNQRFSETVLESMKLVLNSTVIRKMSQTPEESRFRESEMDHSGLTEIQKLIDFVENTRESGRIMMGGYFPQIIAQKLTGL